MSTVNWTFRLTCKGVFTLTEAETEAESDKKWVEWDCVEVVILTETDTVTDVNGFKTHFIGLGLCLCQCECTIKLNSRNVNEYPSSKFRQTTVFSWMRYSVWTEVYSDCFA